MKISDMTLAFMTSKPKRGLGMNITIDAVNGDTVLAYNSGQEIARKSNPDMRGNYTLTIFPRPNVRRYEIGLTRHTNRISAVLNEFSRSDIQGGDYKPKGRMGFNWRNRRFNCWVRYGQINVFDDLTHSEYRLGYSRWHKTETLYSYAGLRINIDANGNQSMDYEYLESTRASLTKGEAPTIGASATKVIMDEYDNSSEAVKDLLKLTENL